jgi:sulfite reductase beta subunit-like hemoprotein
VGVLTQVDGKRVEAYNVVVGGGGGRDGRLAQPAASRLPAEKALAEALRRCAEFLPREESLLACEGNCR